MKILSSFTLSTTLWNCLSFVFLQAVAVLGAPDNQGAEFLVLYMENAADSFSSDLELYVTTSSPDDVRVNVTSPLRQQDGLHEQLIVSAGNVHRMFINYNFRLQGSERSENTVLIQADNDVVVYAVNKETFTNDAYLALPTDVLGEEYYTVSYFPTTYKTQFAVAATHDCVVMVTLPNPRNFLEVVFEGKSYYNGDTLNIPLSQFESFQIQSDGDLTGTFINSTKSVAVFSGNRRTRVDGYSTDHLVEQLPPVSTWGKTFHVVTTPNRTVGDYVKCVASEDGTSLTVPNYGTYSIAKAGESVQLDVNSGDFVTITANKPILVAQIVKSQATAQSREKADPSMSVIFPVEQFAAETTVSTPEYSQNGSYTNVLMIVIKAGDKDGLRLDNQPVDPSVSWTPFDGLVYVGAQIQISHGSHTLYHVNPTATFGGILYGFAMYESFSLPLGMRLAPVNMPCSASSTVHGDGLDNDCDGLIDEEMCGEENLGLRVRNRHAVGKSNPTFHDDDNDGRVDEDCAKRILDLQAISSMPMLSTLPERSTTVYEESTKVYEESTMVYEKSTTVNEKSSVDQSYLTSSAVYEKSSTEEIYVKSTKSGPSLSTEPSQSDSVTSTQASQSCPSGWFSCGESKSHCLQLSFLCDCNIDCDGGWDEIPSLAGCDPSLLQQCRPDSGSFELRPPVTSLIVAVFATAFSCGWQRY